MRKLIRRSGLEISWADRSRHCFHSSGYLRHNARRLEHLASLLLPVGGKSVLEVGAGIGDHSNYFLDRDCQVTITEARDENLRHLKNRFPESDVRFLDMEDPKLDLPPFEVVHCYGLLYHLADPVRAIEFLAEKCSGMLLLETCVSFGDLAEIRRVSESRRDPTQAVSGTGCRPTRRWLFEKLTSLFPHVYVPTTQPNHEEFPLDWTSPETFPSGPSRAVFVASRQAIASDVLSTTLMDRQTRHP
ncbi:class I SAM-dependent methyltransferase [Singulisphaera sp. GP187]|uniref:class I SAM-dependent methyltransferase n=1 Tax=Singulisphaera sp. GP187 TaxID=1882752 RepID=UPI0039656D15